MIGRCRSCNAAVEWAVTELGRKMPLDLGLHGDGRVIVVGRTSKDEAVVVSLELERLRKLRESGVRLMLRRSHFQTCPQADEWRR